MRGARNPRTGAPATRSSRSRERRGSPGASPAWRTPCDAISCAAAARRISSGCRSAKRAVQKSVAGTASSSSSRSTARRPAADTPSCSSAGIQCPYSSGTSNSSTSNVRQTSLIARRARRATGSSGGRGTCAGGRGRGPPATPRQEWAGDTRAGISPTRYPSRRARYSTSTSNPKPGTRCRANSARATSRRKPLSPACVSRCGQAEGEARQPVEAPAHHPAGAAGVRSDGSRRLRQPITRSCAPRAATRRPR